jgi:hypothetical protein
MSRVTKVFLESVFPFLGSPEGGELFLFEIVNYLVCTHGFNLLVLLLVDPLLHQAGLYYSQDYGENVNEAGGIILLLFDSVWGVEVIGITPP